MTDVLWLYLCKECLVTAGPRTSNIFWANEFVSRSYITSPEWQPSVTKSASPHDNLRYPAI